jgi:hypothetical protein
LTIGEIVDRAFRRLSAGELDASKSPIQDGWETPLPTGRTVARSVLQEAAAPLVALGPDAVPELLPHVAEANAALRYVAIHALEEITGERPGLGYFDPQDEELRRRAIATWRQWYETRAISP